MEPLDLNTLPRPKIGRFRRPPHVQREAALILLDWQRLGVSAARAAEFLGCHVSTIKDARRRGRAILAEQGTPIEEPPKRNRGNREKRPKSGIEKSGRPPKLTDEVVAEIVRMKAEGVSIVETAKRLGISETRVKIARRRGRET
jgi:transposase